MDNKSKCVTVVDGLGEKTEIQNKKQMAVQTPSYWKEEKYQPLVEAETLFDTKVKIPQSLQKYWEMWTPKKHLLIMQGKVVGWFEKRKFKKQEIWDLHKVFIERYQE